jgi:3'-phosphoadenosine 5'-phosphosulfate sulfotransferase (PAPS reductase)/FAD synthetase
MEKHTTQDETDMKSGTNQEAKDSTTTRGDYHDYDAIPIESAHDVLSRLEERDPDYVAVACSGGNDSIVTLHFVLNIADFSPNSVLHVDTALVSQGRLTTLSSSVKSGTQT